MSARSGLGRVVMDTRPLRIPAYRRLWGSTTVTAIGSQLTAVAVPLQVYQITGSSAYVGLSGAFALVPLIVFGMWGGAIADAMDRRKLMLLTNAGIALTTCALWAQAFAGLNSVWLVFLLLMGQQACFGMNSPARSASVPRVVPVEQLPAANALNSTVMQLGQIVGPLAAGALIPVVGLSTMYLLDTVALLAALWAVYRLPALPPLGNAPSGAGLRDVLDGLKYLASRGVLLVSFLADIIAMVFGMPRALFPEMAERTFGDPAGGGLALGLLYAAIPIGAVVAGLFSGLYAKLSRHGVAVAVSVCGWGMAVAAFGWSNSLPLAVLFLAIAGAGDMVSMVMRSSILQEAATDEMRGRMQGVFTVVVAGGPRLADLAHGTVGAAVGASVAVSGGGIAVVILMIAATCAFPSFWRYRSAAGGKTG